MIALRDDDHLSHPHRDNFHGKLHLVLQAVVIVCRLRNQAKKHEQAEAQSLKRFIRRGGSRFSCDTCTIQ